MKNNKLTILMYHDIRDETKFSKRYELKSFLRVQQFRNQLNYIKTHYNVVSCRQVIDSVENSNPLPPNPIVLTFDDGLLDHYKTVGPILDEERLVGCFFIPSEACQNRKLMLVHKIQFILAGSGTEKEIVRTIFALLSTVEFLESSNPLEVNWKATDLTKNYLWKTYSQSVWTPNRNPNQKNWWTEEMVFITRFLRENTGLSDALKEKLIDSLFKKFVGLTEEELAEDLYMNVNQILDLKVIGEIGGHGFTSTNLKNLTREEQVRDIELNWKFLFDKILSSHYDFLFSYPHGGYTQETASILDRFACKMAFTTDARLCNKKDLSEEGLLFMPRLCAPQQFPITENARKCKWTEQSRS